MARGDRREIQDADAWRAEDVGGKLTYQFVPRPHKGQVVGGIVYDWVWREKCL
jgi:hypothetical protein